MKYEQEDLLEKFIQNEKKSKFWALLSALAFTLVAFGVVYIAKVNNRNTNKYEIRKLNATIKKLEDKLSKYENKTTVKKQTNIIINYDEKVPANAIEELKDLLNNNNAKVEVAQKPTPYGQKHKIVYFNEDDENEANSISSIINENKKTYLSTNFSFSPLLDRNAKKPVGNIEIWLTNN